MLTDIAIKAAKPSDKPYKLFDQHGLFLLVTPTGSKWWRLKYRFEKKEKLLAFGVYPETSLRDARDLRDDARKLLRRQVDRGAAGSRGLFRGDRFWTPRPSRTFGTDRCLGGPI